MQEPNPHHKLPILVMLLVACLIGAGYSYLRTSESDVSVSTSSQTIYPPAVPKPQVKELVFIKDQKLDDRKGAIFARIALVKEQPLYPNERQIILEAYTSLEKTLTEAEKQLIVAALNTR